MALSIILTILKILGIVVLSIIALVVLILLLVLFVPVRYKADGVATKEKQEADLKVRWLFVTVKAQASKSGFPYAVRLFGIKVYPRKGGD